MSSQFQTYLSNTTHAAPLAVFRILFGILMCISIVRFWYNGWIEKLYLLPDFHFKYLGFSWVKVPPDVLCYSLFIICGIAAFLFAIGFKYRVAIIIFFLSFTYIELMDKTTYLNHYYFVSVISFLLIFLPANKYFSLDAFHHPTIRAQYIPNWNIDVLKAMLFIIYVYAGLAKFNYDWMVKAMPLSIWLPSKVDTPLIGSLMSHKWMPHLFSWGGAIYDTLIPFFLIFKKTRVLAFVAVLFFHITTSVLFPIGMFPYIMIAATLIFFSAHFHNRILEGIAKLFKIKKSLFDNGIHLIHHQKRQSQLALKVLGIVLVIQLFVPLRSLAYPGNIYWTEQGYRFSWRVMLMEKTGYANFKIVDQKTGKRFYVQNEDFLTPFQQKQMATQADFIIEYAHFLGHHFTSQGHQNVAVYVESYASLNGRKSQPYVDPNIDLMSLKNNLNHRSFILPLHE